MKDLFKMRIIANSERLKIDYKKKVEIPEKYKGFFWDCPDGSVILEKYILRILSYGDFEDVKEIYENYPDEVFKIAFKYPEIKRGVKFWIRRWKELKR